MTDDVPVPFPEYAEKAHRGARRPRRPELAGLGVTYVLEAVCA